MYKKKIKLRKNDTVSFIPWFRMNVEIQLNYRRLYFAATYHLVFSSLRTKRTEPKIRKKKRPERISRSVSRQWLKQFAQMNHIESLRSLDISQSVSVFVKLSSQLVLNFFFALSFARSLLIRLVRVCFSCYVLSMYGMPLCPCLTFSWEFEWQANVFLYRSVAQLLVSKRVEMNKIARQANE